MSGCRRTWRRSQPSGPAAPVSLPAAVGDTVLEAEPLRHGQANAATGGIWRVRGPAGTAILKVAHPQSETDTPKAFPTSNEPTHWNYWRREAFAYQTGLAATAYADAGITAPALLGTGTRPTVVSSCGWPTSAGPGFDWPVPRLARFARELGTTQAQWAGRVPAIPWLSRRWLAQYVAETPNWVGPSTPPSGTTRRGAWPAPVRTRLRSCGRSGTGSWPSPRPPNGPCAISTSGPPTWPTGGHSVLLDWAFTGEGALGEDLANLIVDSFTDGLMDMALLPESPRPPSTATWPACATAAGPAPPTRSAPPSRLRRRQVQLVRPGDGRPRRPRRPRPASYRQDTSAAAAIRRLTPLVTLIADWAGWS